tara:strand:- start:32798 stop:33058 length:261 start_codon:yes stop_codon:yes gene_type:complete
MLRQQNTVDRVSARCGSGVTGMRRRIFFNVSERGPGVGRVAHGPATGTDVGCHRACVMHKPANLHALSLNSRLRIRAPVIGVRRIS